MSIKAIGSNIIALIFIAWSTMALAVDYSHIKNYDLTRIASLQGQFATNNEVFPKEANSIKPIELGELILILMPNKSEKFIDWDFRSEEKNLFWITPGIQTEKGSSLLERQALARIYIEGKPSFVLKDRKKEVAWKVTMSSEMPKRFGPDEIKIERYECSWCDEILPLNSLRLAGIKATELCRYKEIGNEEIVWELNQNLKKPTILISATSGGNTVQEAQVRIVFRQQKEQICKGSNREEIDRRILESQNNKGNNSAKGAGVTSNREFSNAQRNPSIPDEKARSVSRAEVALTVCRSNSDLLKVFIANRNKGVPKSAMVQLAASSNEKIKPVAVTLVDLAYDTKGSDLPYLSNSFYESCLQRLYPK